MSIIGNFLGEWKKWWLGASSTTLDPCKVVSESDSKLNTNFEFRGKKLIKL